jgi:acetolactate synthase I/II/III large subunit
MAKGILAEDHPYYAGTLDMACNALMWDFLKGCDLLLAVGFDAVELIKPWTLAVPTVHIDAVPNTDQIYGADTELVGDIAAILHNVADAWTGRAEVASPAEVKAHRDALNAAYYAGRVEGRLNPTDVIDAVREALPRERHRDDRRRLAQAARRAGLARLRAALGADEQRPVVHGLLAAGGDRGAASPPRAPVVCFVGDGGLAMVQGELRLAAACACPCWSSSSATTA